ncbi:hypothetical protein D3C76_1711570 [compost metagenome]
MSDFKHCQREFGAVVAAAAPLVFTLVGVRGVELLNQIGVRAVNFDAVKARLNCTTNRFTELADHAFHFFSG